jgi:hypothetical protein
MNDTRNRSGLVLGTLLVLAGILVLMGQWYGFSGIDLLWPWIVVAVGAVFFVGMFIGGQWLSWLAIPGSVVTVVGLILWFQNTFNYFESWSYAWGLIVAGVGAGIWIAGRWSERPEQARQGRELAGLGLTLFVIFGALMEFIYSNAGVSERTPALVFAILLTLLSIYRLARVFIAMGRVRAEPDWGKRSENRAAESVAADTDRRRAVRGVWAALAVGGWGHRRAAGGHPVCGGVSGAAPGAGPAPKLDDRRV